MPSMKIMQIQDSWSPDNIRLAERPVPELGPGEVLLQMEAASLNYRDYVMARGGYGRRGGALPLVPVSDGTGRVVAVGPGVSRVAVAAEKFLKKPKPNQTAQPKRTTYTAILS